MMKNAMFTVVAAIASVAMSACVIRTPEHNEEVDPGVPNAGSSGEAGSAGSAGESLDAGSAGSSGEAGSAGSSGAGGSAGASPDAGSAGSQGCTDCAGGSGGSSGCVNESCIDNVPHDVESCGEYGTVTQPIYSPDSRFLSLSGQYLKDGASCVELVGDMPGFNWSNGIHATKVENNRWLVYLPSTGIPGAAAYFATYKDGSSGIVADYGSDEKRIACMSEEAKRWLWCHKRIDPDGSKHLNGCYIRFLMQSDGVIQPLGNYEDWKDYAPQI